MKKLFLLVLLNFSLLKAQEAEEKLQYFVDVYRSYSSKNLPEVEFWVSIDASTMTFRTENREMKSKIAVEILVSKEGQLIQADKFNMNTVMLDSTKKNFYGIEKCVFQLEPGLYTLEANLIDMYDSEAKKHTTKKEFMVKENSDSLSFFMSDIQLFESVNSKQTGKFMRGNVSVIPLISNSTLLNPDTCRLGIEIFHKNPDKTPIFYSMTIRRAGSNQFLDEYTQNSKAKMPQKYDLFFSKFSAKNLASDTYIIRFEIKNNEGQVFGSKEQKIFVYNENQFAMSGSQDAVFKFYFNLSEEDLDAYLPTLTHISTPSEKDFAKKLSTFDEKKNYFINFWQKRHDNHSEPMNKNWVEYKMKVDYANREFKSALRKGWKTDRGRVLLVFGLPSDVQSFPQDGDKYPYQVWQYNKLGSQSGVVFVFYDPDLTTNEYPQLHSTKFGEFNNQSWRQDLLRGKIGTLGADDPEGENVSKTKFRDQGVIERR